MTYIAIALFSFPIYFITSLLINNKKRARLLQTPLSEEDYRIVAKNFRVIEKLPDEQKKKFEGLINLFIHDKEFVGCGGQEITREVEITIAAQACILILNNESQKCYAMLKRVLVYPCAYSSMTEGVNSDGSRFQRRVTRLGESSTNGTVVLSWNHSRKGGQNLNDAQNVVIHEFAHQLDQIDGNADGVPTLKEGSCYQTWGKVIASEYKRLLRKSKQRRKSVIDHYGATNEAEFFSCATEAFFEKPEAVYKKHPELYSEFVEYYGLDPRQWGV